MANEEKQVRKAARCVQYLLEAEGKDITSKQIMDLIKDKDLSDVNGLKTSVENDMRNQQAAAADEAAAAKKPNRRQAIETFMVSNWDSLKDNDIVRTALVNAYCQGRLSKDQRKKLADDLVARCNGEEPQEEQQDEPVAEPEIADMPEEQKQLAADLMGDQKFDF